MEAEKQRVAAEAEFAERVAQTEASNRSRMEAMEAEAAQRKQVAGEKAIRRVAARMMHQLVASGFISWADAVADLRRQRSIVAKVLGRLHSRLLASVFESWAQSIADPSPQRQPAAVRQHAAPDGWQFVPSPQTSGPRRTASTSEDGDSEAEGILREDDELWSVSGLEGLLPRLNKVHSFSVTERWSAFCRSCCTGTGWNI